MKTGPAVFELGNRKIPVSTQYHLFIPDYQLYFNGHRFNLPGYYDTDTDEFTVDVKGVDLDKPMGDWIEYPFEGIPEEAVELEVDDNVVHKILEARENFETMLKKLSEEYKSKIFSTKWTGYNKIISRPLQTTINPFEYWDKLSGAIEELFQTYVDTKETVYRTIYKKPTSDLSNSNFCMLVARV